jgi:hypothetical protein
MASIFSGAKSPLIRGRAGRGDEEERGNFYASLISAILTQSFCQWRRMEILGAAVLLGKSAQGQ